MELGELLRREHDRVAEVEWERRPQGRTVGYGDTGPYENPLAEIPRAMQEYAEAPPAETVPVQPQTRTLRQVFWPFGA